MSCTQHQQQQQQELSVMLTNTRRVVGEHEDELRRMRNDMRQMQNTIDSLRQEVASLRANAGTGLAFAPTIAGAANVGQLAGVKREPDEGEAVGGADAPKRSRHRAGVKKKRRAWQAAGGPSAEGGEGGEGGEGVGGNIAMRDNLP